MAYTKVGPFTDYSGAPGISAALLNGLENAAVTAVNGDPWVGYTPTVTGFTIGTGTGSGSTWVWRYEQGQVHVKGFLGVGATGGSVSGTVQFTLPVAASMNYLPALGVATFYGSATAPGQVGLVDTNHASPSAFYVSGGYVLNAGLGPAVPFTWAAGNYLEVDFLYTAA